MWLDGVLELLLVGWDMTRRGREERGRWGRKKSHMP